jgi:hypothetical protein
MERSVDSAPEFERSPPSQRFVPFGNLFPVLCPALKQPHAQVLLRILLKVRREAAKLDQQ